MRIPKVSNSLLAFLLAIMYVTAGIIYIYCAIKNQEPIDQGVFNIFVPVTFFPLIAMFTDDYPVALILLYESLITLILWLILWGIIKLLRTFFSREIK